MTQELWSRLLEVADPVVKIGVGALVGYWLAKMRFRYDVTRERQKRVIAMLEQVTEEMEVLSHQVQMNLSRLMALRDIHGPGVTLPEDKLREYVPPVSSEQWQVVMKAQSKLRLLGEKAALKILDSYGGTCGKALGPKVDKLSARELQAIQHEFAAKREALGDEMHKAYEKAWTRE